MEKKKMVLTIIIPVICCLSVLFIPVYSWAACSGSGLTWSCAAGSSSAQVQSAINSASNGATVTFASGNYSISGISLNQRNGINLICASAGTCNITTSGDVFGIDYIPATITNLVRISGFNFTANSNTAKIWFYGNNNINQIRIDHNTFSGLSTGYIAILMGSTDTTGRMYGVIDSNNFTGSTNHMALKMLSGGETWVTGLQGSANNMFFEDNTVNFANNADLGCGAVDAWKATSIVIRNNTITNSRIVNHSLCHGGPINSEVYNNTITSPTGVAPQYRNIHFQGSGEIMVWGNTVGGTSAGHIALQHFRSDAAAMPEGDCTASTVCDGTETFYADGNRSPIATYRGYPCWHQPGRDNAGTLRPIYIWNNRNSSSTKVPISIETGGYTDLHVVPNRDYYEAVSANAQTSPSSPFNGTTGMGFGTLANRPINCTTNTSESGGGVGYWATDTNTLYRCSATSTWTVHYTPYTYPHPLRTGGGDDPAPSSPQGFRIVE